MRLPFCSLSASSPCPETPASLFLGLGMVYLHGAEERKTLESTVIREATLYLPRETCAEQDGDNERKFRLFQPRGSFAKHTGNWVSTPQILPPIIYDPISVSRNLPLNSSRIFPRSLAHSVTTSQKANPALRRLDPSQPPGGAFNAGLWVL